MSLRCMSSSLPYDVAGSFCQALLAGIPGMMRRSFNDLASLLDDAYGRAWQLLLGMSSKAS
jgi:hypothetical protein